MSPYGQQLTKVAIALCDAVGSPVSQKVRLALDLGDWRTITQLRVDPASYTDPHLFERDYACVELLRKCALPVNDRVLKEEARKTFFSLERKCHQTNIRMIRCQQGPFENLTALKCAEFLGVAKAWITRVLGPIPRDLDGRFGPGATFGDKGILSTIPDKMSSRPTVTKEAIAFVQLLRGSAWDRALCDYPRHSAPEVVRGNRFTTVPKDATKVRGIAVEPSLNIFFQLALGKFIKKRLLSNGIDLIHGQQRHDRWAMHASRDGRFATIDLSNASDTVALELVRLLLPPDWFDLLAALRSPFTRVDGKWVKLEKFSSMGNGFTFELESLIFAGLCFAAGAGVSGVDFSVFGDDIIVPTEAAPAVLSVLAYCGFEPNARKTFVSGPFRESCGGDYFNGVPVRAHYVDEIPSGPEHWISLANGLRRLGRDCPNRHFPLTFAYTAWRKCLDQLPTRIRRITGPSSLGDLVIHDDSWDVRWRQGRRYIRVLRPYARALPHHHWRPEVVMASALYGIPSLGVTPRGLPAYKVGWVSMS